MDIGDVGTLAAALDGVRPGVKEGRPEWRYRGRLVARGLGEGRLLIRCHFDVRDSMLERHPGTFSVPRQYRNHMMIVADLDAGDPRAIEDALEAALVLQRGC